MLQIVLTLALFVILVIPMGRYMYHIATDRKTFADAVFDPVDKLTIRFAECKGEGYELEKIRSVFTDGKCGYGICRIRDPENTGTFVPKSERNRIDGRKPEL